MRSLQFSWELDTVIVLFVTNVTGVVKGESVQDYLSLSFERLQRLMRYIIPNFPADIACNSRNRC